MYGGSERIVYSLAEEWARLGHDVTLFATKEARNPTTRQALNLDALANALQYTREGAYDIIHNHFGWQTLLFNAFLDLSMVTTLHGTLDKALVPTEHKMHNYFRWAPFVSISNS